MPNDKRSPMCSGAPTRTRRRCAGAGPRGTCWPISCSASRVPLWAAIADMVGRREPGQEKYMGRLVKAARSDEGYEALVTQFQKGAPRWSPMSWADESLNFIEYVIHIEDVRRGGDTPLSPRVLAPAEVRSIWK